MPDTPVPAALEAGRRIAARQVTSEELVRNCLARIRERDPAVHAWAHLDEEKALAQARARDGEEPRSPLHGVPAGIKDVIDTADLPTERGTVVYAGRRPDADAACVAALVRAGAVILGKTVSTELAAWSPGPTTNPHDPARTPGGSSSGSAAAVADGMVPLALGTQTAGSTIRPGAFCGTWALKPSYGWLAMDGVQPLSPSLDTLGLFASDAAALGALASVLSGKPLRTEPPVPPQLSVPLRIGLLRTPWWERADAAGQHAVQDAASRCAEGGAAVEEIALPLAMQELQDAHWTIMQVETARVLRDEYDTSADRLSATLREVIDSGRGIAADDYQRAVELGRQGMRQIDEALGGWDALLTPAATGEAPLGLQSTGDAVFCRPWTLLGVPAVAVPGLRGPHGLPIGVQLIGKRHHDGDLLAVAAWVGRHLAG